MKLRAALALALAVTTAGPLALALSVENSDDVCATRAAVPPWAGLQCPSRSTTEAWVSSYDSPARDWHSELVVGPDGTVYSASLRDVAGAPDAGVLRALDGATGAELWRSEAPMRFGFVMGPILVGPRVVFATDAGDVAAWSTLDGSLLWNVATAGLRPIDLVALGSDVGMIADGFSGADMSAARLDGATGAEVWRSITTVPTGERARAAVLVDGLVVGVAARNGGGAVLRAFDAATGAPAWSSVDGAFFSPNSLAVHGGRLYAAGFTFPPLAGNDADAAVGAYSSVDGSRLWLRSHDVSSDSDGLNAVAVSADGARVFAAGAGTTSQPATSTNRHDILTMALDADDGAIAWTALHTEAPFGTEGASSLVLHGDAVLVGGTACPVARNGCGGWTDAAAVAYDAATGAERWAVLHASPGTDSGTDIGVSPDGTLVHLAATIDYPFPSTGANPSTRVVTFRAETNDERPALVAVEHDEASAELVAVSLAGDAFASEAAVSGDGNASTRRNFAIAGTGDADSQWLGLSGFGDANGVFAITGAGNANGNSAISVFGDAEGFDAASVFGDAEGFEALSVFGDAEGTFAVSVFGEARGGTAISVLQAVESLGLP